MSLLSGDVAPNDSGRSAVRCFPSHAKSQPNVAHSVLKTPHGHVCSLTHPQILQFITKRLNLLIETIFGLNIKEYLIVKNGPIQIYGALLIRTSIHVLAGNHLSKKL